MATRVLFPKALNKTILEEDIEEMELGLIDSGKMKEQEIELLAFRETKLSWAN